MTPIVRVSARGEGATADGRYVAFAAPGDWLDEGGVLHAGPHHQQPPCRHFPCCGGCQLQHLDDESWGGFLVDRIAGALAGQNLPVPIIRPPALSPPNTRRRASLHAERRGRTVLLGFHAEASHAIVDMHECWVLAPALFALVAPLRALLGALMGPRGRAEVQMTLADQGVDLGLTGIKAEGLAAAEGLNDFAERHRLARLTIDAGFGPEVRWEPVPATVTLGGVPVALPPGGFLQATAEGEAALVAAVREGVAAADTVADLFAGLGTFALALDARVYAAEAGREAMAALMSAAGRAGRPVFAELRDLFRRPLTSAELDRFGAVVIDPPRAGARDQVVQLAASTVSTLVYVSCSPSSFARDAKILCEGGFRLDWVQPVGQFRWSTHVELAACFRRPGSPRR